MTNKIEYSKDKTKKESMEKQLKTVTKDLQVTLQSLKDLEKPKIQEDTDEEEEPIVKPKAKAKAKPKEYITHNVANEDYVGNVYSYSYF